MNPTLDEHLAIKGLIPLLFLKIKTGTFCDYLYGLSEKTTL